MTSTMSFAVHDFGASITLDNNHISITLFQTELSRALQTVPTTLPQYANLD